MVERDWPSAREKVELDGVCRTCPRTDNLDPAHLWPRSLGGTEAWNNIVALCRSCHNAFDHGELDLGPHLTLAEKMEVVEQAEINGRRDGLDAAHTRLFPSAHPERKVRV